jgi:hypothetical protein
MPWVRVQLQNHHTPQTLQDLISFCRTMLQSCQPIDLELIQGWRDALANYEDLLEERNAISEYTSQATTSRPQNYTIQQETIPLARVNGSYDRSGTEAVRVIESQRTRLTTTPKRSTFRDFIRRIESTE